MWNHGTLGLNRGKKGKIPTMTKKISAAEAAIRRKPATADPLGPNSEIGLVSDDVPDRFAALLSQLEKAETAPKKD
jgi:hypothetical protein